MNNEELISKMITDENYYITIKYLLLETQSDLNKAQLVASMVGDDVILLEVAKRMLNNGCSILTLARTLNTLNEYIFNNPMYDISWITG